MRRTILAVVLCICVTGVYSARKSLDPLHEREMLMDMAYLPNGKMLSWISGGMDDVLSDLLWLRSMRYVMSHFGTDRDYTYLYRIYDVITDLDPNFTKAYRFGAYFLTGITDEFDKAVALLEKGWGNNPLSWEIAYELGSIYNISIKDPAKAAEWFAVAGRNPECPNVIREHATVLYEEDGRLEQALAMWTGIYGNSEEGGLKDVAAWNVKMVRTRMIVEKIRSAVDKYRAETGRQPDSLQELKDSGIINYVPRDGFDEDFLYFYEEGPEQDYSIESRELIRKEIDKRVTYLKRYVIAPFRLDHGRLPVTLAETVEKGTIKKLPPVPHDIPLRYDPETGDISYDRSLIVLEKQGS